MTVPPVTVPPVTVPPATVPPVTVPPVDGAPGDGSTDHDPDRDRAPGDDGARRRFLRTGSYGAAGDRADRDGAVGAAVDDHPAGNGAGGDDV